ncbi:MAG: hypothetical protein HQL48_08055, partial [Gammaproteobacteria bacterium]|nr:hypothetical protein [Gammaproteobacteria bacterium]
TDLLDYAWKAYKTGKTFGSFDGDSDNYPAQQWLKVHMDKPEEYPFIPLTNQIINIRISNRDLTAIQSRSTEEGIPYQTVTV